MQDKGAFMSERYNGRRVSPLAVLPSDKRGYSLSKESGIPKPRQPAWVPQETARERVERVTGKRLWELQHPTDSEFFGRDLGNKELPAYEQRDAIIETIQSNKISILTGETGSGKTTQIAQFALSAGFDQILYLMPRRVIVDNVTDRIEYELKQQLEDEYPDSLVGKVHAEARTITETSRVRVMTADTFTRMYRDIHEQFKDKRVLIVGDEIHKGNLPIEFATAIAAREVERNDKWGLVLSSATLDKSVSTPIYDRINQGTVPTIELKGRPGAIEDHYEPDLDPTEAYSAYGTTSHRALIFTDGKESIKDIISKMKRDPANQNVQFFELHSEISNAEHHRIFEELDDIDPSQRVVIVSTSAGQSGITIPGIDLVISDGITKSPELDEEGGPGLPLRFCTQHELLQQRGRGGRNVSQSLFVLAQPLNSWRRLPNRLANSIPIKQRAVAIPPEILHSNISRNVLSAAALTEDFYDLNTYLRNPVNDQRIGEAFDALSFLGAVDDENDLTPIGKKMDELPLRPEFSRAVIEAFENYTSSVTLYTMAIASALESQGLANFSRKKNRHNDHVDIPNWKQQLRPTTHDDFIAQLDMFLATRNAPNYPLSEKRLSKMGLRPKAVERCHKQFDKLCRRLGYRPYDTHLLPPTQDEEDAIRDSFLSGMGQLLYQRVGTTRRNRENRPLLSNILNIDSAEGLKREFSHRSLLYLGHIAVSGKDDLVAGWPRWQSGKDEDPTYLIEVGFATDRDRVRQKLGHLASQRTSIALDSAGVLKMQGPLQLGALDLGPGEARTVSAQTDSEAALIVNRALDKPGKALQHLLSLNIARQDLNETLHEAAIDSHDIHEFDQKLWEYYQAFCQELSRGNIAAQ